MYRTSAKTGSTTTIMTAHSRRARRKQASRLAAGRLERRGETTITTASSICSFQDMPSLILIIRRSPGRAAFRRACNFRGIEVMCGPRGLPGEGDHLFHNNGDGTFADVSLKAGVSDPKGYYGFASVFVDVDDDGWLDLAVANDSVPKYLYRNKHDGTFEDLSYISGFALNDEGREQASMGIAVGDYNRDGKVDFYITNFSDDYNALYRNDGDGNFSDVTARAGIAALTLPFLGWGTGFLDYDNDGLLDIFAANGHVYPGVAKQDWGTTWAQRPLLFRNLDGAKFQEVPPEIGRASC